MTREFPSAAYDRWLQDVDVAQLNADADQAAHELEEDRREREREMAVERRDRNQGH